MKVILKECSKELPLCAKYIKNHFLLDESESEINSMLKNAVEHVELQTGLSLRRKIWMIVHDNSFVSLINGPIINIISIKDGIGNLVEPLAVKRAHDNLSIQFSQEGVFKITYEAGYTRENLPECLKYSVLEKFWQVYSDVLEKKNDDCLQNTKNDYQYIGAMRG